MPLEDGAKVAVIGAGPAGSFCSYFLLDMAQRIGIDIAVDMYESRDFTMSGPAGCNMCGGIISESLVQNLATEGINLPPTVVKRGISSYVLHMDVGTVKLETPLHEMRIGAVHRGAGPRGTKETQWRSFDGYLLELAVNKGARLMKGRVDSVAYEEEKRVRVSARGGQPQTYDLVVVATGINTATLKLFEELGIGFQSPKSTKTYITEFALGEETVEKYLGSSMHVFLLNIPRLEFAAIIPKGGYATLCILGEDIDDALVQSFLNSREVKECFPPEWTSTEGACHCAPRICTEGAAKTFADRIVFIGDSGITRLYKDGIGAAYRTAKAAAVTAIFEGVAEEDFRLYFRPTCEAIRKANGLGRLVFFVTRQIQKRRFARRGVLRMTSREQRKAGQRRRMSMVLWDTFTGSAPYRDIFTRTLHPAFLTRLFWETGVGLLPLGRKKP